MHALDNYEDSANVSADSTYDWVFAYDDNVEPKTALAISNITLNEAATTDGVTATAGEYDAETGSITVEVTIPAEAVASTEYVIGAKVTVGESDETASVTLTVAE